MSACTGYTAGMKRLALLAFVFAGLAACGNSGPLVHPSAPVDDMVAPTAPAPATTAPAAPVEPTAPPPADGGG